MTILPPPSRLQRALLAVPAASRRFAEKAALSEVDSVFLDLEDSVPPAAKLAARTNAIQALNELEWGSKVLGVRVNALDTAWGFRDLLEVASRCPRLDFIMVPRIERPFDIQHVDALLASVEREAGRSSPLALHGIIETPLALTQVDAIAATQSRLQALSFGFGDFSISMGTYDAVIRGEGEPWTYALARIATACKAHGLKAIDGPFTAYTDNEGLRRRATLALAHGFDGKWVIHPSQIPICQQVFSPSAQHLAWAEGVLATFDAVMALGTGALGQNGQLVDMAHVRVARTIVAHAAQIAGSAPKKS